MITQSNNYTFILNEFYKSVVGIGYVIEIGYVGNFVGANYDYIIVDEAPTGHFCKKSWMHFKDPKLEQTLQTAYTRASLRGDRSEMKRLEQQMKRNRC